MKDGFCWPAFFFGVLWALTRRMWLAALLMAAVGAALALALGAAGADPLTGMAVWLAFALIIGFEANDWRGRALRRRGLALAGVIAADGADAALRRWFDLNATAPATPEPSAAPLPPPAGPQAMSAPAGWPGG